MPATVETPGSGPDPGQGGGAFASAPVVLLVFGFVLLVLLQAWFVRRITQLTARYKERSATSRKLAAEAAELAEEVSGLDRARESNTASLAALERETQALQERIDAFVAENQDAATAVATTAEDDDDTAEGQTTGPPAASEDS